MGAAATAVLRELRLAAEDQTGVVGDHRAFLQLCKIVVQLISMCGADDAYAR